MCCVCAWFCDTIFVRGRGREFNVVAFFFLYFWVLREVRRVWLTLRGNGARRTRGGAPIWSLLLEGEEGYIRRVYIRYIYIYTNMYGMFSRVNGCCCCCCVRTYLVCILVSIIM